MVPGRERILDAAAQLFVERGYAETSLRDIAAATDMKAGSLYYHFASKDELFVSVLDRGIALMIEAFDAAEVGAPDRGAEVADITDIGRLESHVRSHLDVLHHHYPYTALHVSTFRTAPASVRDAIVPLRDAYEAKWTDLLRDLLPERSAQEIGILRLVLFGAMNASIDWFDAGRGNLEQFAGVVTDQFWSGAARQERQAS